MRNRKLTGYLSPAAARIAMLKELRNWTWINQSQRDQIAESAKLTWCKSRFGNVYTIEFSTDL